MSGSFSAFELAGWQRAAAAYTDAFGPLTAQVIEPLLDAVEAAPGVRLLDVATGPGHVAAAAARRGAHAVGVDFATAMVERARHLNPGLDVREADAEALPFAADSYDAAVTSFGLLHFARPEHALRELRRVLRPGGRVAFTVWAAPERAVGFAIVLDAISAHGAMVLEPPAGPPFFRFSDVRECERVLVDAGFVSPTATELPMVWTLPAPEALFDAFAEAAVRTGAILNAQPPEARAAIRLAVANATARYKCSDVVAVPMQCVLASARAG